MSAMTSSRFFTRLPRLDLLLLLGGLIAALAWVALFLLTVWPYMNAIATPRSAHDISLHAIEFLKVSVFAGCAIMIVGAIRERRRSVAHGFNEHGAMNPAEWGHTHQALPYYTVDSYVPEHAPEAVSFDGETPVNMIEGRACVVYSDGSVDVDTRLGPRRFSSVEEARAFLGAGQRHGFK